jgi:hypothetical protein
MSHGYSMSLVYANKKASIKNPGVALGRFCIDSNIPVVQVSEELRVSRMTVYNWFSGAFWPSETHIDAIEEFTGRHKKRK